MPGHRDVSVSRRCAVPAEKLHASEDGARVGRGSWSFRASSGTAPVAVELDRPSRFEVPQHRGLVARLAERRAVRRGDRVERRVPDQLEPDAVADSRLDLAAQAARDERIGAAAAAVALGAIGLAVLIPKQIASETAGWAISASSIS
jgi:hypothetical protein